MHTSPILGRSFHHISTTARSTSLKAKLRALLDSAGAEQPGLADQDLGHNVAETITDQLWVHIQKGQLQKAISAPVQSLCDSGINAASTGDHTEILGEHSDLGRSSCQDIGDVLLESPQPLIEQPIASSFTSPVAGKQSPMLLAIATITSNAATIGSQFNAFRSFRSLDGDAVDCKEVAGYTNAAEEDRLFYCDKVGKQVLLDDGKPLLNDTCMAMSYSNGVPLQPMDEGVLFEL